MIITLKPKQKFKNRRDICDELGGDTQKGISISNKINAILLVSNKEQIYKDDFYSKSNNKLLYTGIGQEGNQDDLKNNSENYYLNIAVLSHKQNKKRLLVFDKIKNEYEFLGEYKLIETYQNTQPDKKGCLRRVFVFHLERITQENKKCLFRVI